MNAIGYSRISTSRQSEYSLENQEKSIRDYCIKNNLTLLSIFKDDGESSYTFDRPDFNKLEAFIKQNKNVQYLIVSEIDRFSRNIAEALTKIKELQDKYKIKVVSTTDNFDTDFSDPMNFILRTFKLMMAESELHRIRQRTKEGYVNAAKSGRYLNKAPYGYINDKENGKGVLKVDEEKAFVVRVIFKEYNRGTNLIDIREIVKPFGYQHKGRSAITRVLTNPLYAGLIKIPAHKGTPESIGKASHPAIISEADYYNAQRRLNGYKRKGVTINEQVPLKGVLKCSECDNFLSAGNSRGKKGVHYWYYLCSKHRVNYSAIEIHKKMNQILDLFSFSQEKIDWHMEESSRGIAEMFNRKSESIAKIQRALRTVNEKIEQIDEKYLSEPTISKSTYNRSVEKLRTQQIQLKNQLSELDTDQSYYLERLNNLMPKLHDVRGTFEGLDFYGKQAFLNLCFNHSLTYSDGMFRTPFLHSIFSHNASQLEDSGLLKIEKGTEVLTQSPSYHVGDNIRTLMMLADLLAA